MYHYIARSLFMYPCGISIFAFISNAMLNTIVHPVVHTYAGIYVGSICRSRMVGLEDICI